MTVDTPATAFMRPDRDAPSDGGMTSRRYWLLFTLAVTVGATLLIAVAWSAIVDRSFSDPDDMMRLQEVRDWLAGQSWFDVSQYRIDPPAGLSMHWSRLVDVPLAAMILATRPLLGSANAELFACIAVPFLTYVCLALLVAKITQRLSGNARLGLIAAALTAIDGGAVLTVRPMRIDHHGWQAVCGLAMVAALIGGRVRPRTTAALAGCFAALWINISLEGIMFTAVCGVWLGLAWVIDPQREQGRLPAYLGAVTGASLILFLVVHGGALFDQTFCDAISPVHMIAFAIAAAGTTACLALGARGPYWRLAGLALTAAMAGAVYRLGAPQCAGGPFASLGPLAYEFWYLPIGEGLPLWKQPAQLAVLMIGYPLAGLAMAVWWVRRSTGEARREAITYAALLFGATLIGIGLERAGALSNLLALPAGMLLAGHLWKRAERLQQAGARIAAMAGVVLLCLPITPNIAAAMLFPAPVSIASGVSREPEGACLGLGNLAHLDAIPPALMLATPGSAEALIVASHHSSVSAGYHRDRARMEDVIRFFLSDEATAHAIARRTGPRYLMFCRAVGDARLFAHVAPNGMAARLEKDDAPAWLEPVPVPGAHYVRLYRIVD